MAKAMDWILAHRDYPHEDYCLIWPFTRDKREGRATMALDGKSRLAHRVMCELVRGPAPDDKPQATHSCGSGHLGCVNPKHLDWGSNSDNQLQRYAHGRHNPNANGSRSQFTPEQIETIRSQWGEFTQEKLAEMYGVSIPTIQYYLKYRETRGHAGGKINHWRPDEIEKLRDGISRGMNFTQLSEFLGRPPSSVGMKAYRLGLASGQPVQKKSA